MGVCNFKLKSLYTGFLDSIKLSGYKMGIKFDEDKNLELNKKSDQEKKIYIYIVATE